MKVLVVYHSRNGHTHQAAEAVAKAVRDQNAEVIVKSIAELRKVDVENANALFVGTWVHGMILFGVRPAGADQWVPSLPSLSGKPVGIFCTYAFHPRGSLKALTTLLEARGAVVKGKQAFHRSRPGDGADQFVSRVLSSA
jgi:flavodoxin